jgi:hypothetical protein
VCQCLGSYNVMMWQWSGRANKGPPNIGVTLDFIQFQTSQYLDELFYLLWFTLIVFANAQLWEETIGIVKPTWNDNLRITTGW